MPHRAREPINSMSRTGQSEDGAVLTLQDALATPCGAWSARHKRLIYDHAFGLFMDGWDREPEPTTAMIAERLGIPNKHLILVSTNGRWLEKKAERQMQRNHAEMLSRTQAVHRVDKVTLEGVERVVTKAFDMYVDALEKVRGMGDSTAPRESSEGSPVKSELEVKVLLLARVTQGAMAMANGAKSLGLVKDPPADEKRQQLLDPAKLASLSLTIINNGSAREVPVGEVIDITETLSVQKSAGVLASGQEKAPPG